MGNLVSVIVPVYKVEQYLDKCLESIVNQTYENLEIILIDDGSPDSCPSMCDEWAKKDNRIRVIHKNNEGIALTRNCGLDAATGEYVMFVDSDDSISLRAVENMVKRLETDNSDIVIGQRIKVYSNEPEAVFADFLVQDEIISKEEAFHRLYCRQKPFPTSLWAKLYRKKVFDSIRFKPLTTAEDTCAAPDIIDQCNTVSVSSEVVYFYFQRTESITHAMTREKELDNMKAMIYVAVFLLERNYIKEASHYYHAAVCSSIRMKGNKESKQLLHNSFNKSERRLLKQARDKYMVKAILMTQLSSVYNFYKLHIARSR